MYINTNSTSDKSKRLPSKHRSSPCIFQVVVSLSLRSFRTYFLIIFSCFHSDFSVKSIKFSTKNSKYFIYILQQLLRMRRTHVGNVNQFNFSRAMPTLNLRTGMSKKLVFLSERLKKDLEKFQTPATERW